MGVIDWVGNIFSGGKTRVELDAFCGDLTEKIYYKELAIQASVNLIANTLSNAEFLTFEKGVEVRKDNYYLFNVEPNQNKSSSKFWREVVTKLVYDNECLVVQIDGKLHLAEEFESTKYALKENIYKDVIIENYKLKDTFKESEVMHFELHNKDIKSVVEELAMDYSKLTTAAQTNYRKNNSRRGLLKVNTAYAKTAQAQNDLKELLSTKFKSFFNAEGGAVLPLTNGESYEELISNIGIKGSAEGLDIKTFITDIFDFVAIAFNIPPVLLKGEVADTKGVLSNFVTFCISPIATTITDEVNRKYYGKRMYLEKTYVKLDTTRVKSVDITDIAGSLDVLLRIGAYDIDSCLRALGKEEIGGEIGKQRFITKNYQTIEDNIAGEADFKEVIEVKDTTIEGGD